MGHKLRERVTLETIIEKLIEQRKKIEALTDEVQRLKLKVAGLESEKATWMLRESQAPEPRGSGGGTP